MARKLSVELEGLTLRVKIGDTPIGVLSDFKMSVEGDAKDVQATFPSFKCSDDVETHIETYTKLLSEALVRVFRYGKQIAGPEGRIGFREIVTI